MAYHISPETGNPSICRAKTPESCKFNDSSSDESVPHFETKDEARDHYEKSQGAETVKSLKKDKTYEMHLKASELRVGDIVQTYRMTDSGLRDTSSVVKKITSVVDLNRRPMVTVTYEDGKSGGFSSVSPMLVRRDTPQVESRDPAEVRKEFRRIRSDFRKQGYLSDDNCKKVLDILNDPNVEEISIAHGRRMVDALEDINQHDTSLRVSAAVERYGLSRDADYQIRDAYALMYDNKTPDDIYVKAAESNPSAYKNIQRNATYSDERTDMDRAYLFN